MAIRLRFRLWSFVVCLKSILFRTFGAVVTSFRGTTLVYKKKPPDFREVCCVSWCNREVDYRGQGRPVDLKHGTLDILVREATVNDVGVLHFIPKGRPGRDVYVISRRAAEWAPDLKCRVRDAKQFRRSCSSRIFRANVQLARNVGPGHRTDWRRCSGLVKIAKQIERRQGVDWHARFSKK